MKVKRQSKILELIRENDIETQEMLADLLNKAGLRLLFSHGSLLM